MEQPYLRPSKRFKYHDPINVLSEVNKSLRSVRKRRRKNILVDSHQKPELRISEYLIIYNNMFIYRRKHGLTNEAMELLIYAYLVFRDYNEGITSLRVCRELDKEIRSELQGVRNKLNKLVDKGYLLKVGKTLHGGYLYIPSVSAINDIENVFSEK